MNVNTIRVSQLCQRALYSTGKEARNGSDAVGAGACDYVGPPHFVTRLRPLKYYIPPQETQRQRALRVAKQETDAWNHQYWHEHNTSFEKSKKKFVAKKKAMCSDGGAVPLTADQMAEFYKCFLDSYAEKHFQYNREWYGRNFTILRLALGVWLEGVLGSGKRR